MILNRLFLLWVGAFGTTSLTAVVVSGQGQLDVDPNNDYDDHDSSIMIRQPRPHPILTVGHLRSKFLQQQQQQKQQNPILGQPVSETNCFDQTTKDACYQTVDDETNKPCSWCQAGAIPSECVTQEQASQLPSGVFDCSTPGQQNMIPNKNNKNNNNKDHIKDHEGDDVDSSTDINSNSMEERHVVYQFTADRNYTLHSKPVATIKKQRSIPVHETEIAVDQQETFCDASSKSISGYVDIKGSKYDHQGENKHLFFWMFEKRGSNSNSSNTTTTTTTINDEPIPFVVWLTGGPGCSSTLALLTENGPCSVNSDGTTTSVNPYSWTEAAHVLWLDQPAGVGFSYGEETDSNEDMVSEDAYYFFQAFVQTYPEYANSPFYIIGESYAGHYIPAIADRIQLGNQMLANRAPQDSELSSTSPLLMTINLQGVAIGNGYTNPELQYPSYPEMCFNNSHGLQVIDETTYQTMKAVVPKCTALIQKCNQGDSMIDVLACQSAFYVCNIGLTSPYQMTGLNPYDIRKTCDKPPLCYDFSHVAAWLHKAETKAALHVDPQHSHSWSSCNYGINMKFNVDRMKDMSNHVAHLLEAGQRVLIYVGDVDFICNYIGNTAWTLALPWSGQAEFQASPLQDWKSGQGSVRSARNFTYLQIRDAGHMVPADQPKVALEMLQIFLMGGSFV